MKRLKGLVSKIKYKISTIKFSKWKLLLGVIIFILLTILLALLIISPEIQVSALDKPEVVTSPESITANSTAKFEIKNRNIFIELDGTHYTSSSHSIEITGIPEGKRGFNVRSVINLFFFKLISKENEYFETEFDYTGPDIKSTTNIKDEYFGHEPEVRFTLDEKPVEVFLTIEDKSEVIFSDKNENFENEAFKKCSVSEIENSSEREFICNLKFNEERGYIVGLEIKDHLGNASKIFDNSNLKFIIPLSLNCDFPSATNQDQIIANCTPNKDGAFVKSENETIPLTQGTAFTTLYGFQTEGVNTIKYTLIDTEGREFQNEVTVIKDTEKPLIDVAQIPRQVDYCPIGAGCLYNNTKIHRI